MHLTNKIFAEWYEEQDAEHTSQGRGQKDFDKVGRHVGIFRLQDVDGRQREDGTGHDGPRAGSDALDDDILAECILPSGSAADAHGNNGDGDSCFENLADLQSQVCCGCAEDDSHQDAPADRPQVDFSRTALCRHHRFVLFAFVQLSESVLGQ